MNITNIQIEGGIILVEISSTKDHSYCPCCNRRSDRIHSKYTRTLKDLPILDKKVILKLQSRKFFCDNVKCDRTIFTERYKSQIYSYARKTDRLNKFMEKLAFATSAETASKIINSHIATTSPDSIIKILEKAEITINTDYECIGVDDWAFKKGNKYGTLICDLKTHEPIAILENRDYKALSDWLRDKTDIKYCSRDRSKIYAAAINDTLPKALHIADRFHLVHNIGEVIVDFLKRQYTNGIKLNISNTNEDEKDISNYRTRLKKEQEERYNKKWQLIMQVQEMYKSIPNISHICRCFSLDRKTVSNYIEIKEPPDPQSWKRVSILDEYKPIVIELVKKGKKKQYILEAIKKKGYRGSERTLRNFIKDLKDEKYNIYLLENPENKAHKIQRKKMMTLLFCLPEN